ncbi:Fis family transcriptional regulator [Williamsia sp. 1138]|uniref:sigma-54-dependent Fis family transcriptional regulator n=1 Tax=Williamsia sp. 1138 TaxID=1903117 RepID=UPI000A0F40C0|nr:helix-turn-helix domain-containing protein [Williamsia sp. 1138]OZG27908.1 Fis family transcriptional regulator [Williamsia sp. 1138]
MNTSPESPLDRPVIAQSWRRSQMSGLHPEDSPDVRPVSISARDHPLLRAASPVLDEVAHQLADSDTAILLVDSDARLISRTFGGVRVERVMESVGAVSGVGFAEDAMGTTALGTPLEIRGGITINASEHFLDQFKAISCYGRPILHPVSRRLEGIICMSNLEQTVNPLFAPFVDRIAGDIEQRLLDNSRARQLAVVEAFQRVAPRRDVAVVAIGDDLLLTNALAADILASADFGTLRAVAADLDARQRATKMTLSSGNAVDLIANQVPGSAGGALFRIQPTDLSRVAVPRKARAPRLTPEPPVARTGWRQAAITGEPGTGRTSAAMELLGDQEVRSVDAATLLGGHVMSRLEPLIADLDSTPLLIENVHLLDAVNLNSLRGAILAGKGRLVLTAPPLAESPGPVAALISLCPNRIDLAPLRRRTTELPALASQILARVAPRVTLGAAAGEALLASDWPGNLSELTMALQTAADRCGDRGERVIAVSDLPAQYQTSTKAHRLSGRDRAERAAIVEAMAAASGNKVHAAKTLGISRSTLYTRLRALGIDH